MQWELVDAGADEMYPLHTTTERVFQGRNACRRSDEHITDDACVDLAGHRNGDDLDLCGEVIGNMNGIELPDMAENAQQRLVTLS